MESTLIWSYTIGLTLDTPIEFPFCRSLISFHILVPRKVKEFGQMDLVIAWGYHPRDHLK